MLNYRINRPNQLRNLSNSIDGFNSSSYSPKPTLTGRDTNDPVTVNDLPLIKSDINSINEQNIIDDAATRVQKIIEPDKQNEIITNEETLKNLSDLGGKVPFGLNIKFEQQGRADKPEIIKTPEEKNHKNDVNLVKKIKKHLNVVKFKKLFVPNWPKLKDWEEFKIFSAGAALAAGMIVLGFYLGFNRPLSFAESQSNDDLISNEVLAEHVVKDEPVIKETSDGHKVEVSRGINPNDVDRRPPVPLEPNMPSRIKIPSIRVNAPIKSVGLLPNKSLAVPNYVYQVGWYDQSSRPGEPGTVLMDGHYGVSGSWGVFSKLKDLSKGSEIEIIRSDGQSIVYVVEDKVSYDRNSTPMDRVLAQDNKQRLSIITCDGTYLPKEETYTNRLVVYAVRK